MTVQLVVTFGHVHLDGLVLTPAQAAQSAAGQIVAPLGDAHGKTGKSHGIADVDCPICALIQLASTSAPSVAPPLPIPATLGGAVLEAPDASAAAASPIFAFQARGPPAV